MAYGIFIGENCQYTNDTTKIRAAKTHAEIQNGAPCILSGLETSERDLWTMAAATATTAVTDLWVVNTPELIYDEGSYKTKADFVNASGEIARVVKLTKGDIFAITAEAITETPSSTNCYLAPKANGWTAGVTGSYNFAKLLETETVDGKTFYAYEVC